MRRNALILGSVCLAGVLGVLPVGALQPMVGENLTEVIDQFRADGLNIFYSSELVTEDLVVVAQPTSVDQARMLDEILAPHG
ncbi:MAG: hypothetical protein GY906_29000, partial [bacterium]|nr:hypothetical protein [bacterium]